MRAELDLHGMLTLMLPDAGPGLSTRLWTVRAHRAEMAEEWHRRLPELREMPRETFVPAGPASSAVPRRGDITVAVSALRALIDRYTAWASVAVGPADGPVAATLERGVRLAEQDIDALTGP